MVPAYIFMDIVSVRNIDRGLVIREILKTRNIGGAVAWLAYYITSWMVVDSIPGEIIRFLP
jgi:hypothetical protein